MSKTADDLREVIRNQVADQDRSIPKIVKALVGGDDEIPGLRAHQQKQEHEHLKLLRKGKLHFAGAEPWENGLKAMAVTSDHLQVFFMKSLVLSLTRGIHIGRTPALWQSNFDELFGSEEFEALIMMQSVLISSDHSILKVVADHYADCAVSVAAMLGFKEATGKSTQHVWDVWRGGLGSATTSLYTAGVTLGRKQAEEELFSRINTEENE